MSENVEYSKTHSIRIFVTKTTIPPPPKNVTEGLNVP